MGNIPSAPWRRRYGVTDQNSTVLPSHSGTLRLSWVCPAAWPLPRTPGLGAEVERGTVCTYLLISHPWGVGNPYVTSTTLLQPGAPGGQPSPWCPGEFLRVARKSAVAQPSALPLRGSEPTDITTHASGTLGKNYACAELMQPGLCSHSHCNAKQLLTQHICWSGVTGDCR